MYALTLLCAVALGGFIAASDQAAALIVPVIVTMPALTILSRSATSGSDQYAQVRILRWTLAAFAAHLLFGLVVTNLEALQPLAGPDSERYHRLAIDISRYWRTGGTWPVLPPGSEGYYYLLAALYWLFGPYPAAGLVINAALAAAFVPLLSSLTQHLFGSQAVRYVGPLVLFVPGLFFWPSLLLKEAAAMFLVVVCAYCGERLTERVSWLSVSVLTVALTLLFTIRGPIALVVGTGLLFGLLLGARQSISAATTVLSCLAFMAVLMLTFRIGYSGFQSASDLDLERANRLRTSLSTSASSGFDPGVNVSTPGRALLYLPKGLIVLLAGPFPWQLSGGRQLAILPDLVAWWLLLPLLVRGVRWGWALRGRRLRVIASPASAAGTMLALAVGDFGTLVRERMQIFILLIPFIALGLSYKREPRQQNETSPTSDSTRETVADLPEAARPIPA